MTIYEYGKYKLDQVFIITPEFVRQAHCLPEYYVDLVVELSLMEPEGKNPWAQLHARGRYLDDLQCDFAHLDLLQRVDFDDIYTLATIFDERLHQMERDHNALLDALLRAYEDEDGHAAIPDKTKASIDDQYRNTELLHDLTRALLKRKRTR